MIIRKSMFCGFILLLTTLFMFSLSTAGELKSLSDVDLIRISSYVKDGVLQISLLYKNRDRDELVSWREGTVRCDCEVYENVGSILDKKKGQRITSVNKTVKSSRQDIYVDIPSTYLNKGKGAIIECTVNTGYKKLNASGDNSLR
ncbi:MAG: hypothetical protein WA124_13130 [Smithella sp.]